MVVLGVCGIMAMSLSIYHIQSSINDPFLAKKSSIAEAKKLIGPTDAEKEDALKRKDTDGDGLSDWDEQNVYHTNPYMRDTCGDGLSDNVRVLTGKNMSCPKVYNPNSEGIVDLSGVNDTSTDLMGGTDLKSLLGGTDVSTQGQGSTDASTQSAGSSLVTLPRDAATIRQALKGKITDDVLNSLTDDQLLQYYDQAVAQSQGTQDATASSTVDTGATDTSTSSTGIDLNTLPRNATAIRQALKGKLSDVQLNQLTDDQLLQMYDQALQAAQQQAASGTVSN